MRGSTVTSAFRAAVLVAAVLPGLAPAEPARPGPAQRLAHAGAVPRQGEAEASRRQVMALLNGARGARDTALLLHALDAVDRADPWALSFSGALLPSDNINGAATARHIDTDMFGRVRIRDGGAPESGFGLRAGATLRYTHVVGPGGRLSPALSLTRVIYPRKDDLDRWIASPSLSYRVERPRDSRSVTLALRRTLYDARPSGNETRATLSARRHVRATPRLRYDLRGAYGVIDRDSHDALDGTLAQLGAGLRYGLGGRMTVTGRVGLSRRTARCDHNGHEGIALTGGVEYRLTPRDLGALSIGAARRVYHAPIPGLGQVRGDTDFDLTLGLTTARIDIMGAAPRVSCSLSRTVSNVALYDTRATTCAISLERRF